MILTFSLSKRERNSIIPYEKTSSLTRRTFITYRGVTIRVVVCEVRLPKMLSRRPLARATPQHHQTFVRSASVQTCGSKRRTADTDVTHLLSTGRRVRAIRT